MTGTVLRIRNRSFKKRQFSSMKVPYYRRIAYLAKFSNGLRLFLMKIAKNFGISAEISGRKFPNLKCPCLEYSL